MQWLEFYLYFSLAISWLLGAWISYLYRENILANQELLSLSSSHFIFHYGFSKQVSELGDLDSIFRMDCFLFFFFIFCLSYENLLKMNESVIFRCLAWIGKISFSLSDPFSIIQTFWIFTPRTSRRKPSNFLVSLMYLVPVIFWLGCFLNMLKTRSINGLKPAVPS